MAERTTGRNTDRLAAKSVPRNIVKPLQFDWWLVLLDLALLGSVIPLIFTDDTIFFFHFIFVLLTIGAFFWSLQAFAIRAGLWVTFVIAVLLFKTLAGDIPVVELLEIPLLGTMLVVAFAISRQRGRAQDALRGERDTLDTIMENTQTHLAYLDPEFNFVGVNSAYVKGSGHSREELLGHNHFALFPNPENQAVFEQVRATGQPAEFHAKPVEYPDQPERGVTYWDWTLAPVKDEDGQVGGLVLSLLDVTERVRAEARLREQNQFITTVFESLRHPFYVIDAADYSVRMANSAAVSEGMSQAFTCYALTHRRTTPCGDAGHPCPVEEIKRTAKPVVMEHVHHDNEGDRRVYEIHGHPILDDAGQVVQVIEYALDVTERKQMEEALRAAHDELEIRVQERTAQLATTNQALRAEISERQQAQETLRESEERYRRLVELSFEAIVIHTAGKLVYVNPQAVKLLGGASPEEFIGKPIRDFVHPDYWDAVQARVQRVGEEGRGMPLFEEKLIRLDGQSVDVEAASVPIVYQGRPAVQSVIHDISPRKRAEAERERERARLARDLHDSLGHSLGYLHLKLDELTGARALSENLEVRQELGQMRDVTNQAYEVVRGMLAASLPYASTDLSTALLVQARSVGQRKGFEVQLTTDGQPRRLSPVVQQQLLYLFQEALVNVEKHANARQVDINLAWGEDTLILSLSDDGEGFDPGHTQADGHFGLAIMQERAQEINGQLSLNSRPGSGTQLVLRLPLETALRSARPMRLVRGA